MLSALLHSDRSKRWVDRDGETQLELVAHAHRIAALLPAGGRVVVSCRQARSFVPGLLGAWSAGATVELLPNVSPGTLDRVDADDEVAYVLHDDAARQGRSPKALYVPAILSEPGAPNPLRTNAWPDVAVRMTTSGTTERPRSVTKSMAQLLAELDVLATVIPAARCVLSTVPLSHLYGLLLGALLPLRSGARIVSHEALLPADVAAIIEREQVDLMVSTPAHLRAMAQGCSAMPRRLRVISSGARMPPELHVSLVTGQEWHVTDILGSTETGGIATRHHPMSAWTCLPGVTVSAPDGQLVVDSPWCARVELDDRVEMRPGGTFQHLGRNTELVKIAGKRAHAAAIEATVLAVRGVTDVALVIEAAAGKEPRVALAISVTPGEPVGREEIATAIRHQFDAVFVPKIFKVVPRIPRTDRGKVDADALRELLGVKPVPTAHHIPVRRVAPGTYLADVPCDLVFFRGHFETFAILPGAVLVERVVWPIVKAEFSEIHEVRGIRRLRFRRPVFGDQQLSVTVQRERGRVMFEVSCAANVVASGQLLVD